MSAASFVLFRAVSLLPIPRYCDVSLRKNVCLLTTNKAKKNPKKSPIIPTSANIFLSDGSDRQRSPALIYSPLKRPSECGETFPSSVNLITSGLLGSM